MHTQANVFFGQITVSLHRRNRDVFGDLKHQASAVKLNVANPTAVESIPRTIIYDANGNRTSFSPYGTEREMGSNLNI